MSEVGESAYSTTNRSYPLPKRSYCHSAIFLCSSNVWHTPWKLLWALDGGSNDDQLEHSFNEQRLIYLSFLNWHRLHLPYLNTIVIRRHICLDIGIKVLRIIWKKQKRFRFCNGQGYEHEVGRLRRDGKTYLDTSATMFDFAIKPL